MKPPQNPSFPLLITLQILICVDCRHYPHYDNGQYSKGIRHLIEPRPDMGIIYTQTTFCGAVLIHPNWLMYGYSCLTTRLGLDSKKFARSGIQPFQFRNITVTRNCGKKCGFAIAHVRHPFKTGYAFVLSRTPEYLKPIDCEEAHLLCSLTQKPWRKKAKLDMYYKIVHMAENTKNCWSEDEDFYKFNYLCGKPGPENRTVPDFDLCDRVKERDDPKMYSDGPLMCKGVVIGFLDWKSCDDKNKAAFGNIADNKRFIGQYIDKKLRGRSEMEDVQSNGRRLKGRKISIIVTMSFWLFLPCVQIL